MNPIFFLDFTASSIVPLLNPTRPTTEFSIVVLPHPLEPSRPKLKSRNMMTSLMHNELLDVYSKFKLMVIIVLEVYFLARYEYNHPLLR